MIKFRTGVKIRSGIKLKNSLGGNVDIYGNMPATFTIAAGFNNQGTKNIGFSEPVILTLTGGVTLSIDGTPYESGDTIPPASIHTLNIRNPGVEDGTITFGKRKQITYLVLNNLGQYAANAITCDITGMSLTTLYLHAIYSSVITGDITGMPLRGLKLRSLGPYSVITGEITGMELTYLRLYEIGSSMTYGTNSFIISASEGLVLRGNTVFATAEEYERLIIDAASGTWWPVGSRTFEIQTGTSDNCPDWDNVKSYVAELLTKAAWTIIPPAWLEDNGGTWPAYWYFCTGEGGDKPAIFTVTAGDGTKYVRVQVSETTTVIPSGGTSIRIGDFGDFVNTPLTLAANTDQDIYFNGAGSFAIPQRKLVIHLFLANMSPSVVTCDITGMRLTFLTVSYPASTVIAGSITGMNLGNIYLAGIGSSLSYGVNTINIIDSGGIQLLGNTVFATAAEYERLIRDSAAGTWSGVYPFTITAGTNDNCPDWENVKSYVATLLTKAAWEIIPAAWLITNGGTWPEDWDEYEGGDENPDGELPATFIIPAEYEDTGMKMINFSEPVILTLTGGVTLSIDGTPYESGDTIPVADEVHELTISNPGEDAGSITFGKRKQITMLGLAELGSSVITCDITGMNLMALTLQDLGSSVITGDITGMGLMMLALSDIDSSVAITGDITGMNLMMLYLVNLSSSVAITGDITGMNLMTLILQSLGSSSVAITGDISGMEIEDLVLEDIGLCDITGI